MKPVSLLFSPKSMAFSSAVVLLISLFGVFLLGSSAAKAEAVQGVIATPYNSGAVVSWNPLSIDQNTVTAYEISYGLYSVAEGLADTYDQVINTGSTETSYTLQDLNNGFRYYVAVRGLLSDQSTTEYSEETTVTPSSIYSVLPQGGSEQAAAAESDATAPTVQSALALTNMLIKVEFSEDIELPDILPELSFTVTKNDDPSLAVTVEKAEYKTDYAGAENEDVHENIIFVTLEEGTEPEVEYTVTVSAAVTDPSGNPIESGVTDFAVFTGTDRTEIPEEEKPLTNEVAEPAAEEPPANPAEENGPDITPPENVRDLAITAQEREADFWLDLTWKKSSSDDVVDQKLYESKNGGEFGSAVPLGKDAEAYGLSGAPESELSYKVTAMDAAGNENSGMIASIRLPALASTGAPFALLALGATLGLSGIKKYFRK